MRHRHGGAHVLYRFFDRQGDLLYVGITMNPLGRFNSHRGDKSWWSEVGFIPEVTGWQPLPWQAQIHVSCLDAIVPFYEKDGSF